MLDKGCIMASLIKRLENAGFSPQQCVTIENIVNDVCEHCWESEAPGCVCMKEEEDDTK
jgi:hypothetical protein